MSESDEIIPYGPWPWVWTNDEDEARRAFVIEHLGSSLAGLGLKQSEFVEFVTKVEEWLRAGAVQTAQPKLPKLAVVKNDEHK